MPSIDINGIDAPGGLEVLVTEESIEVAENAPPALALLYGSSFDQEATVARKSQASPTAGTYRTAPHCPSEVETSHVTRLSPSAPCPSRLLTGFRPGEQTESDACGLQGFPEVLLEWEAMMGSQLDGSADQFPGPILLNHGPLTPLYL